MNEMKSGEWGVELEAVPGGFRPSVFTCPSLEDRYFTPRRLLNLDFLCLNSLSEIGTNSDNWTTCLGRDELAFG